MGRSRIGGDNTRVTTRISGNRVEDRDFDGDRVIGITTHTSDGKSHDHEVNNYGIAGYGRGPEKK